MCGRATYKLTWEEIIALYQLTLAPAPHNLRPRFNVCPTTTIDTIMSAEGERELMRALGPRAELVEQAAQGIEAGDVQRAGGDGSEKPFFRRRIQAQALPYPGVRLLRVAGYAGRKAAVVFHAAGRLAGAYDRGPMGRMEKETGKPLKSCTMIITEPNEFVAEVHDRMPVLLTEDQFDPWLSAEAGIEYLKPAPNDFLQKWPVSKRVNSSRADDDDPTLIEKIELRAA